ncbi:MAG TPA: response regulator [Candidatus Polarisedimenticolia bacterium]|nr:response regulator [Candidatus Polarisedimenticolia bacterium]
MRLFQNAPLHRRIGGAIILASAAGLLVSVALVIVYETATMRPRAVQEARAEASLVALNMHGALNFNDPDAARENLRALGETPSVQEACVYRASGEIFATYRRDPSGEPFPPPPDRPGHLFQEGGLLIFQPISYGGELAGYVYLKRSMVPLTARLMEDAVIVAIVLLVLLVVSLSLSRSLRRGVSGPILDLARTARSMADRDGARGAPAAEGDEIESLRLAFADMIAAIDQRERSLREANKELESRGIELQRELSERHRAEEALRESEERLRLAMEAARIGTWDWNLSTGAVTHSPRNLMLLGLDPSRTTLTYEEFEAVTHPQDRDRVRLTVQQAFEERETYDLEFRVVRPDGSIRWIAGKGSPFYDDQGRPVRMIGVGMDVSERKTADAEIRRLNETLEQRVAERTAVAEQRTRQLRALAVELTQAEQRERRRLAQLLHDHLQQLLVAAQLRMSHLRAVKSGAEVHRFVDQVDDLLRQSIQASRDLTVHLSPPILYEGGLAAALEWLARKIQEQHGLWVRVSAEVPRNAVAQDTRLFLFHAVRELLFNVIKHAGTDRAEVRATMEGAMVRVSVLDEGSGMAEEQGAPALPSDRFGLFSIRERVELLGGRLEITSERGVGSRVTLTVPSGVGPAQAPPETAEEVPEPRAPAAGSVRGRPKRGVIRILLADDHKIVREGLAALLAHQPDMKAIGQASNGEEAVRLARELQPDVIVMDASMPVLGGVEATRKIMAEAPHIKVIGLSMFQSEDMSAEMRSAGAVAYLTKDRASEALVDVIRDSFAAPAS